MHEKLFSIGKTAEILNVSVATLRHYDKLGLVKPEQIDAQSGYRYYSIEQFHYIDRIKYLQKLGFKLSEISSVLQNGTSEYLLPLLEQRKREYDKQINEIQKQKEILEWYIDFFSFKETDDFIEKNLYEVCLPERYILAVPYEEGRQISSSDIELLKIKNLPGLSDLHYKRQWGCILDFNQMLSKKLLPKYSFLYLNEKQKFDLKYFKVLPAGMYVCFRVRLFQGNFGPIKKLQKYFENVNIDSGIVIANEYENNFHDYTNSMYEIQIEVKYK
ncbi:MerR family transcriptional regulator [Abyssisolibacter fermentans]|uniref:MerR family transcriptional regulator n=1 Tax=Abyssisolibacter fermentans TaxID=1766203 RepID=UPI000832B3C0|nr:helix-turn-helix domain-containing protein [Abyssisolibacter fermentans]